MYHIRRADNHDERSMHADTLIGLEAAVAEAVFRTRHQGHAHEIYDDVQNKVVHLVTCPRGFEPGQTDVQQCEMIHEVEKPSERTYDWFAWMSIGALAAALIMRAMGHP